MTELKIGDRVKVDHLEMHDEPCSDTDVLIGKVGTVTTEPYEDDFFGVKRTVVDVVLDEAVSWNGGPTTEKDHQFCFEPSELENIGRFQITYIDVDSGEEKTVKCADWKAADALVRLYQRNAIPAWHND